MRVSLNMLKRKCRGFYDPLHFLFNIFDDTRIFSNHINVLLILFLTAITSSYLDLRLRDYAKEFFDFLEILRVQKYLALHVTLD